MASVYAITSADYNTEDKKKLFTALARGIEKTFSHNSVLFNQIPPENFAGSDSDQLTVIICVPPYMDNPRRTIVVRDIQDEVSNELGDKKPKDIVVLFKYHPDDNCAVRGEVRSDSKAKAEALASASK